MSNSCYNPFIYGIYNVSLESCLLDTLLRVSWMLNAEIYSSSPILVPWHWCFEFLSSLSQEKFKREFYKRFSFFHKYGFGKRFHQSASAMNTGATTLTDYQDKTVSLYNTRASISHHSSHINKNKKSCCVRNENLYRGGNGVVFKNSYVADDDDENYTITSNPFAENNRYNSEIETEDFEFTKIIWKQAKPF